MSASSSIILRFPQKEDATLLLLWENDEENWRISETEKPYSLFELLDLIQDIKNVRQNKQVRFVIEDKKDATILGTIDLFDIDFKNKRAEVGILIASKEHRRKGKAKEALLLIEKYAREHLSIDQLYCTIHNHNLPSIYLFESMAYIKTGTKKNWYIWDGETIDAYFYQKNIKS